jgi:receptor protein-tyrosine kinase
MSIQSTSTRETQPTSTVRRLPPRSLGAILIDSGKLKLEDANRVLQYQKERSIPFGQALVELGLVSQADVDRALASQYNYPYLQAGASLVSEKVVAAYQPQGDEAEALRVVRSQLILRWFQGEPSRRVLAVVSARAGEGRSYIAANLAVVFSQMGERVLLIDADLRQPSQHALFGLDNRCGLSTVLSDRSALDAVQRVLGFADLSVLVAGPIPPNPQELLSSESFAKLLQYVSQVYDVVIIDTPPAMQSADAQVIVSRAKGALIVARKDYTAVEDLKRLADQIQDGGSTPIGIVLNEFG